MVTLFFHIHRYQKLVLKRPEIGRIGTGIIPLLRTNLIKSSNYNDISSAFILVELKSQK